MPTSAPLRIAVLTVSDTRDEASDRSGALLVDRLTEAGHVLAEKRIVRDDVYQIRAALSVWIADAGIDAVITTGGTGFASRDVTPQAVVPLLDAHIDGFGELFRSVSFSEIGTSMMQSRAVAGIANHTLVFCLPGSTGACRTGWDRILGEQLDVAHRPCNFAEQLPRLKAR